MKFLMTVFAFNINTRILSLLLVQHNSVFPFSGKLWRPPSSVKMPLASLGESSCELDHQSRWTTPLTLNLLIKFSQCHFLHRSLDCEAKISQHLPSAGAHLVVMMVLGLLPNLMRWSSSVALVWGHVGYLSIKNAFVYFYWWNVHPASSASMEQ